MTTIRFERDGAIGNIVLANPPFNRLDLRFAEALRSAVRQASESDIAAHHPSTPRSASGLTSARKGVSHDARDRSCGAGARPSSSGPITLTLYAAIDQEDTNWIVVLKDVGPDVSVRTAREGERDVPSSLPERELTRRWLKASYRALDEKRSKPWEPFHKLTQDSLAPVKPGEVVEYRIQILATANQFKAGHRICLDITSMDVPTGTGAMTDVEYIPYHVCSSKTVTHKIYRD